MREGNVASQLPLCAPELPASRESEALATPPSHSPLGSRDGSARRRRACKAARKRAASEWADKTTSMRRAEAPALPAFCNSPEAHKGWLRGPSWQRITLDEPTKSGRHSTKRAVGSERRATYS